MSHTSLRPNQVAEIAAMRSAGYTITVIAQAVGVSVSTVQRHLKSSGSIKGTVKAEVIAAARQRLLHRINSDETIRDEAARLIADDLAHTTLLRERAAVAAEWLVATNVVEAALVMRAAAAYSTVIKNTSDTLRRVMQLDRAAERADDDTIPELRIRELSDEEIVEQRRLRCAEDID